MWTRLNIRRYALAPEKISLDLDADDNVETPTSNMRRRLFTKHFTDNSTQGRIVYFREHQKAILVADFPYLSPEFLNLESITV